MFLEDDSYRRVHAGSSGRRAGVTLIEIIIVLAIISVVATMGVPKFLKLVSSYKVNDNGRRLQSVATLAHVKAAARNTRYRVTHGTSSYTLQYCADDVTTRVNPCSTWSLDETSAAQTLPGGVTFSLTGITNAPPIVTCASSPCTASQDTEMTFNSRGLLFDETSNAPATVRCFYLTGTNADPVAVCSVLTGRTIVYRLAGSTWIAL